MYRSTYNYIKDIVLNSIGGSYVCPMFIRRWIYMLYGHKVSRVLSNCFLGFGTGKLLIKENSYCNYRCFFDLGNDISIGKRCSIGMNVSFINSSHKIGLSTNRAGDYISKPIIVEDGCWIGANVTILAGVIIQKGCIIGAGSLVVDSCEPNGLYLGVPAIRIRDL